jgi:hypothetical protein
MDGGGFHLRRCLRLGPLVGMALDRVNRVDWARVASHCVVASLTPSHLASVVHFIVYFI